MADNTFDFLSQAEGTLPAGSPEKTPGTDPFTESFNRMTAETTDRMLYEQQRPLTLRERISAPAGPTSMTYVPDQAVNMYRYQEGFQGEYFNPLDTSNYQKWADKETFGSALSKGFDSFGHKFGNTFVDYWKGYGRMADALIHMDWDRMKPDETTMAEQYYQDQLDMSRNFVFEQPEDEDGIFTKRTMSEFIGNAGFALGTFAGLGLEIAADIAITAATGGAGAISFGATATRVAAKEGAAAAAKTGFRFADTLTDLGKGFSYGNRSVDEIGALGKTLGKIDEATSVANMSKTAARNAMGETFTVFSNNLLNVVKSKNLTEASANLLKSMPLVGTGIRHAEKLAAASKAGASTAQLIGMGAQGIRRVAQELNMSATEASFEAVTSYGDTLDKMVKQYSIDNNGAVPNAQEFETMRSQAMKASSSNYNTNMALLLATNKIQFGNLFNKFIPANKFMSEVAEDILKVEGKAGRGFFKQSGFFGTYGALGQVAKEFGKKEAAWQFSKAFAKDFLKFEVTEGIQENLQETSAAAWRDYYAGQVNGVPMSLGEAFGEGFSEQFTKQGMKTFLMGALTGSIIRIPTAGFSKAIDATNRAVVNKAYKENPEANPYKMAEAQLDKDIATMNSTFKDLKNGFRTGKESGMENKVFNFTAQMDAAQQQSEAAAKGLQYEFHNAKDNALLSAVASAQRTNSIDVLYRAVKEMGTDMTAEQFEKSFGVKLADTKYSTPTEFSEAVAKDVKKYADTMEGLRTKVKNTLVDPNQYAPDTANYYVAMLTRSAQEDAIQILAMNAIKGEMTAKRAQEVANDLLSVPGMNTSSDYALRVLTNPGSIEGEVGNITAELRILQDNLNAEGIDAETKKDLKVQISAKERELELINKWKGFWESRMKVMGLDKEGNEVKGMGLTDVFIGKPIEKKQVIKDENGNEVEEVEKTYDPMDKEVLDTFRELMNIKNKQAGINAEISEEAIRDGFQKIYDYIRLDRDTKDYMRSVDALMNPDNFRMMQERMVSGKFKYRLIHSVDQISNLILMRGQIIIDTLEIVNEADMQNIFNELVKAAVESENYKNLAALIGDPKLGIDSEEYAYKTYNALADELEKKEQELMKKYGPSEQNNDISQEDYDEIVATEKLDSTTKFLIADKLSRGVTLSELETKVYQMFKEDIDREVTPATTDTTADTESSTAYSNPIVLNIPEDDAEVSFVGPDGETITAEEAQQLSETAEQQVETPANDGASNADNDYLLGLMGEQPAAATVPVVQDPDPAREEQDTPFAPVGNEATGFDVVDQNNNAVNPEKFTSEEQAVEMAESLNQTRSDLDFIKELLGADVDPLDVEVQTNMLTRAQNSMKAYNKRNKTSFTSLEEYYRTPDGKFLIDANKESLLTGKPVNYKKKKVAVAVTAAVQQVTLFETPSSGRATSLTLQSLETLHAKVVEFRNLALQNPNKFSKFVEKGNVTPVSVTESSVLSKLQEITSCFS